ncbi:hypothetical protein [Microbacterium murale]|nr:hypothetical protein [Microbacterium murale]
MKREKEKTDAFNALASRVLNATERAKTLGFMLGEDRTVKNADAVSGPFRLSRPARSMADQGASVGRLTLEQVERKLDEIGASR